MWCHLTYVLKSQYSAPVSTTRRRVYPTEMSLRPDISADFAEAFSSPNSVSQCTLFEFYNYSACDVHFVHDTEMNLTLTCFL